MIRILFQEENKLQRRTMILEMNHSRATKFSEEQFAFKLPLSDVNICSDILNVHGKLCVATVNPPTLYIIPDDTKPQVLEIDLYSHISKFSRGDFRPRFKLGSWSEKEVLVHEETVGYYFFRDQKLKF